MGKFMRDNGKKGNSMESEAIIGLIKAVILVNSKMGISMVKVNTPQKMVKYSKDYGKMVKEMERAG